jgi:hypothetical protein
MLKYVVFLQKEMLSRQTRALFSQGQAKWATTSSILKSSPLYVRSLSTSSTTPPGGAEAPMSKVRSAHKFDESKLASYLVSQKVIDNANDVSVEYTGVQLRCLRNGVYLFCVSGDL